MFVVSEKPDITYCFGRASVMVGDVEEDFVEADCHDTNAPTVYTNLHANRIMVRGKKPLSVISVLYVHLYRCVLRILQMVEYSTKE